MATQAYDDEELSISLSPSQIRRNKRSGGVGYHSGSMNAAVMAGAPEALGSNAPLRDKMRTEQRIGAYNIVKTLGEGSFGKVKLAVHRGTGQRVALKIIPRKKLISRDMQGRVEREIEYLQLLRHPHIIKLFTVIKTPAEIIMVLEYAGGELFDYIVQNGKMKEDEARRFFQQMLCAVEYCHRHKIVHRDLKPENLLLDENLNVKVADFGLSNIMSDGNFLKTSCGSPNYAAPEVIGGKLYAGPEVDVWSCGVILYVLLVGRLPFDDEHIPSLFAKIARGSYMVPTWMSPGASALIKKMLVVNPVQRATIEEIRQDPWFLKDLPAYLHPPVEEFMNTGVDLNKAIKVSDIAPQAPRQVQEKLHNEVTEKISKTMGYGKRDVQEALEAEEPSAIKDAYMIVRENKLMQNNRKSSRFIVIVYVGSLPLRRPAGPLALEWFQQATNLTTNPFGASPTTEDDQDAKLEKELASLTTGTDESTASPLLDPNMSSARSIASTSTGASTKPYISKVGVLPSSLPAYHKVFMEREKAKAAGVEIAETTPSSLEPLTQPRSQGEKEETLRRLKPHSRSQLRLDEANKRPQGLTPVNPPKKTKPVRWQFGIRSRNAPWEALVCIYKALAKLGAGWIVDEDYEKLHQDDEDGDYEGSPRSRKHASTSSIDPTKVYRLPADPWHIKIRWTTDTLKKHSVASGLNEFGDNIYVATRDSPRETQIVAMRMEIQIYEMEHGVYLVDFKVDGYETANGRLLEDKEVTSPFPFLDLAARLIMQLADAD
ncbi:kinase-like domain-containing protein [Cercophora newfieldiana]|uniref:non-specific serine/threonine protein kinase n=1 Tax=Cercophora newfieldiana TaxID=92897 RepID=A0AA39XRN6_9PEZI|nr:kinase-like domain-containing protein [Cercophora newfieldiana]